MFTLPPIKWIIIMLVYVTISLSQNLSSSNFYLSLWQNLRQTSSTTSVDLSNHWRVSKIFKQYTWDWSFVSFSFIKLNALRPSSIKETYFENMQFKEDKSSSIWEQKIKILNIF